MKKGTMVAMAGFLIVLALFGYSYYANKADAPSDKETTVNAPAPKESKAPVSSAASTEEKAAGSATVTDKPQASPGSNNQSGNNTPSNSTTETKTAPVVSKDPAVKEQAPQNAAEAIELAKKNGESMWLLFRSATCAPCVEMQKVFAQLEPDYKGKMRFISIDVNDRMNIELVKSFKIQYIPTTFIIDGSGNISYQNVGIISTDDLKKELNKVVK